MAATQSRKTVFPNGLTLVTERTPGYRSLSIGFWLKIGTRHEQRSEAGISHFLEHMLFKGTDTRSSLEIAREVERVGGEFNAFTSREYTCFHLLMLGRDLGLGMEMLKDVLLNSRFDGEELERERRVILQEIAMTGESPEELAHDLHLALAYGNHGLGKDILGSETSIRRMKRNSLMRYFREHYRPDQLVISVAGDVSHDAVKRELGTLIRHAWPGRPVRAKVRKSGKSSGQPEVKPGFWWITRPTEQVHLIWGVEGPRYSSKDRFAAFLLNVYLGGGMSSALFQEIREKRGMAYNVYSNYSPFSDSGIFTIYAETGMGQVPLCLRLIEETAENLSKNLLPEEELKVIQDNLKGTILLGADNVEARMTSIARNEIFFGESHSVESVCEAIDAVTPKDIRRLARKLFAGDRSILALGPRPSKMVKKLGPEFPKRFTK
jgi:predicted Zn-dependent peptidase